MHDFFGDFYQEVFDSVDKIAEQIRALDAYAPGSFKRFMELTDIEGEDRVLSSSEMLSQLLQDNAKYLNNLTVAYTFAEQDKQLGLSNFIQDRLDQHKKHQWMLKSFLKVNK
jgi:starvation-inducible DNA-binding protein